VTAPDLEALDAPFDQYQRYRLTGDIARALYDTAGVPPSVLDVGGSHLDLWWRWHLPIAEFLPEYRTVTLDVAPNTLRGYVRGRGDALPFADDSFDLVSAVDVLEHVPPAARPAVLRQALRVASRAVVVAAPFRADEIERAEAIVSDFVLRVCGYVQGQLREHREHGWPALDETVRRIEADGWTVRVFSWGNVWQWAFMMIDKHAVQALAGSRPIQTRLDRAYNESSFAHDRTPPCYRHFVLATARADDPLLEWAAAHVGAATLESTLARPTASRDTTDALVAALEAHARNQEIQVSLEPGRRDAHIVDVETHRRQAFEALTAAQAEIDRLNTLLRAVERSPAFRVASWARRLLRRRP